LRFNRKGERREKTRRKLVKRGKKDPKARALKPFGRGKAGGFTERNWEGSSHRRAEKKNGRGKNEKSLNGNLGDAEGGDLY